MGLGPQSAAPTLGRGQGPIQSIDYWYIIGAVYYWYWYWLPGSTRGALYQELDNQIK